jgi:hypothetical protein
MATRLDKLWEAIVRVYRGTRPNDEESASVHPTVTNSAATQEASPPRTQTTQTTDSGSQIEDTTTQPSKYWDLFISHASEDKEEVALPLANTLKTAGLRVWLDKQELRVGDSLREKIDEGLAKSHFGVVILSNSFLDKRWPRNELNGLMA